MRAEQLFHRQRAILVVFVALVLNCSETRVLIVDGPCLSGDADASGDSDTTEDSDVQADSDVMTDSETDGEDHLPIVIEAPDPLADLTISGPSSIEISGDNSGNLIIGGDLGDHLRIGDFEHVVDEPGTEGFVAQLTADGELIWVETVQIGDEGSIAGVGAAPDGEVVVAGSFEGTSVIFGEILESEGGRDMVVAAIGSSGDRRWVRTFGTADDEWLSRVQTDDSGHILVAGEFYGAVPIGENTDYWSHADPYGDVEVARFDQNGELLQWYTLRVPGWNPVSDLSGNHLDGKIVVSGILDLQLEDVGGSWQSQSRGYLGLFWADSEYGQVAIFQPSVDIQALEAGHDVLLIAGYAEGNNLGTGPLFDGEGGGFFIAAASDEGEDFYWAKGFAGRGHISTLHVYPDGTMLVTGRCQDMVIDDDEVICEDSDELQLDTFVAHMTSDGEPLSVFTLPSGGLQSQSRAAADLSGNFWIAIENGIDDRGIRLMRFPAF